MMRSMVVMDLMVRCLPEEKRRTRFPKRDYSADISTIFWQGVKRLKYEENVRYMRLKRCMKQLIGFFFSIFIQT